MPPRSIWKGAISFGMVTIPVRLTAATESKDIQFHLVHKNDHSRLKQKRWCPVDDREVTSDEVVRAFEFAKDRYVELTDEDLAKLPLSTKHTVELTAFVQSEEIDPIYYEKSYYLEPEEMALKPYALLLRALRQKKVVGIAKIALRNKERLCALRPTDDTLVLETLYYPDEVRQRETSLPDVLVSDREVSMAASLVEALEERFDPERYQDRYREALKDLIESKLQGQETAEPAPAIARPKAADLLSALKASVEAARKDRGGPPPEPERKKAPAAKKASRSKAAA